VHGSLNDDNMSPHHMNSQQPLLQWKTYHHKISVLEPAGGAADSADHGRQDGSAAKPQAASGSAGAEPYLFLSHPPPASQAAADGRTRSSASTGWTAGGEDDVPRSSVLMELTDRVGVLHDVLRYFWKYDVNICRIESRPSYVQNDHDCEAGNKIGPPKDRRFDFFVDMEGSTEDANVRQLLNALKPMTTRLLLLDEKQVHWFPRHISELDKVAGRTLDAGVDLEADHPGFRDAHYRARRDAMTASAKAYRWDEPIPSVQYTDDEVAVWSAVWDRMEPLWHAYACREYNVAMAQMKLHCGYSRTSIPQQQDISAYLQKRTNFRMRPVAGLLSSRDFLNGLAFRVFFSTQYIRHHSRPLYTPEPDICHELLGHAPMFADRDFADFSQEIGLASLGASDEDVDKLARVRCCCCCVFQFNAIAVVVLYSHYTDSSPLHLFLPSATGTAWSLEYVVRVTKPRRTERGCCRRLVNWSMRAVVFPTMPATTR
jgi:phenylalanine-4-hydroxylase